MMKKEVEEDSREWKGSCENDCIMKSNEQIHAIPIKSKCPSLQKQGKLQFIWRTVNSLILVVLNCMIINYTADLQGKKKAEQTLWC